MDSEDLNKALQEVYTQRSKTKSHAHQAHVNKLLNHITEQMVARDIFHKNAELAAILAINNITTRNKTASDSANLQQIEALYGKRFGRKSMFPRAGEDAYMRITSLIDYHIFTVIEVIENFREHLACERELSAFITQNPDIDLVLLAETLIMLREALDENPELIALLSDLNNNDQQLQDTATTKLNETCKEHAGIAKQLFSSISMASILEIDIKSLEKLTQDVSEKTKPNIDLRSLLDNDNDESIEKRDLSQGPTLSH